MNTYHLPESPRKDAFKLPEDYFQQLENSIMDKVDNLEAAKEATMAEVSLWTKFKPYLYAAAMFVMLFVGIRGGLYLVDRDSLPIAQDVLEKPEDMPLESQYTAEEYLMGSVNASTMLYYLFEDAINHQDLQ